MTSKAYEFFFYAFKAYFDCSYLRLRVLGSSKLCGFGLLRMGRLLEVLPPQSFMNSKISNIMSNHFCSLLDTLFKPEQAIHRSKVQNDVQTRNAAQSQFIKLMPRWEINLHPNHSNLSVQKLEQQLPTPFGFTKDSSMSSVELPRRRDMVESKLFDVATASKSQIFMTIFMFWMFGNNISIFVLFPIIQTLTTSMGGLLNMAKVFEPYEGMLPSLAKYKLMYSGINLVLLGIVLYKMSAMGMLPVLAADYVDLVPTFDTFRVMAQA